MRSNTRKRDIKADDDMPSSKRRKLSHDTNPLPSLYINDSDLVGLLELQNVGEKTAKEIIKQRNIKHFESEDDLIKRVRGITMISIKISSVKLVFVTQLTEQFHTIFGVLLRTQSLQNQSQDTLKIITQYAIGDLKYCDRLDCHNEIFILNTHERKKGWWTPKPAVLSGTQAPLRHPQCYIYHDRENDKTYYKRNCKTYGNAVYCGECTQSLRNCEECSKDIYFEFDDTTYNMCPGRHYTRGKMCLNCTVCSRHCTSNCSTAAD
eukprot:1125461_1